MATALQAATRPRIDERRKWPIEAVWAVILCVPYAAVFLLFVLYPVFYGLWMGSDLSSYTRLFNDPTYSTAVRNTIIFLAVAVNLKLFMALMISGFFVHPQRWIRWVSMIFILPWAIPSIPTILSFRWMLNSEWGMINGMLFQFFGIDGPWWLIKPDTAFGSIIFIHIWKYLPFWTLILVAARMAIPKDFYEAAAVDGATATQRFRYVTFPGVKNIYITSTLLSTVWSLGDFNSVYLLTGGGPVEKTHVLATLGIRYAFQLSEINVGVATVITALPLVVPLVFFLVHRLGKEGAR